MIDVPYTVTFDGSTTSQMKKQLNIYVCYGSEMYDQVINGYRGSCFVGHYTADDLLKDVQELLKSLNLKESFQLPVGMDGLNFNLKIKSEKDF